MANINRDYLVINDVKKSNVSLDNGSITFYITDKNTQNIFVNLVINISDNKLIQKYANIENAEDYTLTMHIVKPDNTYEIIQGKLHDKANAIFEFDLPDYCCDKVGSYRCELLTKCYINDREEITTSNKITYKVKSSVLNDLDDITEAPEYPLVIQLFDKLSDIEQYEEDRRANELARQLAEEQRQAKHNELVADMTDSIQAMDNKVVEVENRITTKEQAVDKLIVDTKADIDNYKVAKDAEIDEYKALKDTEINEAIANQNTTINAQNDKIEAVENNVVAQNSKLDTLETKAATHEARITAVEAKDTEQDSRLDVAENRLANIGNDITNTMQPIIDEHTSRLDAIEAIDVAQNNRLDAIEAKNQQQDDRLLDIEKVNSRQNIDIKCLYGASQTIDVTKEGNSIYLQNSNNGFVVVDEIKGNTLVNCNKEPDKEIILNGNINTSGYSNVTLTDGVNGGLVDVALEGNTMVNVCDQKDPVAITKSYTVETGNHVALQGEYDGKCRPVVTGNTLVNLCIDNTFKNITTYTPGANPYCILAYNLSTSITYTIIGIFENYSNENGTDGIRVSLNNGGSSLGSLTPTSNKLVFTPNIANNAVYFYFKSTDTNASASAKFILLEGDYTNKPIPEYFEGLQSSFEDNLVTQEMVDSGEEAADNLGKYKVNYKVTGKNKINKPNVTSAITDVEDKYVGSDGDNATKLTLKLQSWGKLNQASTIKWTKYIVSNATSIGKYSVTFTKTDTDKYLRFANNGNTKEFSIFWDISHLKNGEYTFSFELLNLTVGALEFKDFQIEEGTQATPYEPYKEYKKTFYLNSPLLEGDTIEQSGNNVVHIHRSEIRAYQTDDELTLPTDMTNTLVPLAEPQYEAISQNDTILCDSYVNGHLDVDSVVPIEKVDFLHFEEELTYLYPSTQYAVQFVSDAVSKVDITLGGAKLLNQNVVIGANKYTITTPSELIDNNLVLNGEGFNASNIVVTEATDQDFGYFEGMKSVGECEDLVMTSANSDNSLSNAQQLTHEPLRAVGDIKDKYVLIDGKWYIERNCGSVVLDGSKDENIAYSSTYDRIIFMGINVDNANNKVISDNGLCSIFTWNSVYRIGIKNISQKGISSLDMAKQWLQSNPITVVYQLATPEYEPIDYNPFTVYSDITHISNNSTIPCNMTIKNTGYNCLLKPSTTYTVSSNLGLNTVTTPSTLTEDCLRFYDTDTSTVTTMKNVTILEGDYTTGKPLPAHFSGIESCFEQEYDEVVGKYKVKIRIQNEDASKENYIEFYINEPLRGVGDVKDKVYVKNNKVVVERNCGQREYQDGDFGTYLTDKVNTVYPLAEPTYEEVEYNDVKLFIESFKNSTLFYNSNIPVTSTVHYSYSVPIIDTVSQTANVTDQQDSMIIDLATQVAVMEMMLM